MPQTQEQLPSLLTRLRSENDLEVDLAEWGVNQLLECVREVSGTFHLTLDASSENPIALTVRDGLVQEAQLAGALSDVDEALSALQSRTQGVLKVRRVAEPQRKMIFGPNTTQALASIADSPSVVAHAEQTLQREVPELVSASSRPPSSPRRSKMQTKLGVGAPPSVDSSALNASAPPAEESKSKKRLSTQIGVGAPPVPAVRTASKVKTKLGLDASPSRPQPEADADLPFALADTVDMPELEDDIDLEPLRVEEEPSVEPAAAPTALPLASTLRPEIPPTPSSGLAPPSSDGSVESGRPAGPQVVRSSRTSSWIIGLAVGTVVLVAVAALGLLAWRNTSTSPPAQETLSADALGPVAEVEAAADTVPAAELSEPGESVESESPSESEQPPPSAPGLSTEPSLAVDRPPALDTAAPASAPAPDLGALREELGLASDAPALDISNALVAQGRRARSSHDLGAAERHFRQAARIASYNPRAHAGLAGLLYRSSRPDEALEPARRAVLLGPTRASYHVLLGDVLDAQGNTPEAVDAWQKAHDLRPDARVRVRLRGAGVQVPP